MKCRKCQHVFSKEEVDANLCWNCGAIINPELISDNIEEVKRIEDSIDREQKKQEQKEANERKEQFQQSSEYSVISTIHTAFGILTILSFLGSIVLGISSKNFLVFLALAVVSVSSYCFFRLLIAIAYLLCDIRENSVEK